MSRVAGGRLSGVGDTEVGIVLEKCLTAFSPSLGFESLVCL